MFVCRACTKRASINLLRRKLSADTRQTPVSRTLGTSSIARQLSSSEPQNLSSDWGELDAIAEKQDAKPKGAPSQRSSAAEKQKALEKLKRATKKELQYTTDPYHIAENVANKLEENDYEKALMLTREASKNKQVVVSWNHLLSYEFKNQRLHSAIKLYNEVGFPSLLDLLGQFLFSSCSGADNLPR